MTARQHIEHMISHVTHVADAVVGKDAHMPARISHELRIARKLFKISLLVNLRRNSAAQFPHAQPEKPNDPSARSYLIQK